MIPAPPDPSLPIGVFDSGAGGLTVAAVLRRRLPGEALLYLGDMARLPYGTKSPQTVVRYACQAARFLLEQRIKLLVVACNTASAHALPALADLCGPIPVVGVIEAGARAAAGAGDRIVVIATEGTCGSGAFPRAIAAHRPAANVTQVPCPLFVALAEEDMTEGPIAESVAQSYLGGLFGDGRDNDALLLGCTHFPLLLPTLRKIVGPEPALIDCGEAVADEVAILLERTGLAARRGAGEPAPITLTATDTAERMTRLAARLLPELGREPPVAIVDL